MHKAKLTKALEHRAWRINKVFDLSKKWNTPKQIAKKLKIGQNTVRSDQRFVKDSFKKNPPIFLTPVSRSTWSPAKARRAIKLIEFAEGVLGGQISFAQKKKKNPPKSEKAKKAIAALKRKANWNKSCAEIASKTGLSDVRVGYWRKQLIAAGKIPEPDIVAIRKRSRRDPKRKTNTFKTAKARKRVLAEHMPKIKRAARNVYKKAKNAFDATNTLPEEIVDEIAERLDWKLQIYDPARLKGSNKTKLSGYLGYQTRYIANALRNRALERHKRMRLPRSETPKRQKVKLFTSRKTLKAKVLPVEITLNRLEEITTALQPNVLEKAVLYGLAAGLQSKVIAKKLAYPKSRISTIRTGLIERTKRLQKRGVV